MKRVAKKGKKNLDFCLNVMRVMHVKKSKKGK